MTTLLEEFRSTYSATQGEEMGLEDYFDLCKREPAAYATASERMLAGIGDPELVDTRNDQHLGRIFGRAGCRAPRSRRAGGAAADHAQTHRHRIGTHPRGDGLPDAARRQIAPLAHRARLETMPALQRPSQNRFQPVPPLQTLPVRSEVENPRLENATVLQTGNTASLADSVSAGHLYFVAGCFQHPERLNIRSNMVPGLAVMGAKPV